MIWHRKNHSLPLKSFKPYLNTYTKRVADWQAIIIPLLCHIVPEPSDFVAKNTKQPDFDQTLGMETGVLGGNESHPLLLKCCKTLI